jgi:hypothetical protein
MSDDRGDATAQVKTGGKKILRLALFETPDIVDGLFSREDEGHHLDKGIEAMVREMHDGAFQFELETVPPLRSDVLLQQLEGKSAPAALGELGVEPVLTPIFDDSTDVIVFSIEPDVTHTEIWMHRDGDYLVDLSGTSIDTWTEVQREALASGWVRADHGDKGRYQQNLLSVVRALKERTSAHLIAFNGSNLDPTDSTMNYAQVPETVSERIRRLNLALLNVSIEEGISIVDVDRIVAESGGNRRVKGALRYSADVSAAICREFLRIIEDIGFFEQRPLLAQRGRSGGV